MFPKGPWDKGLIQAWESYQNLNNRYMMSACLKVVMIR